MALLVDYSFSEGLYPAWVESLQAEYVIYIERRM